MSNDGVVITLVKDTDIVSAVLSFLAVLTSGVTLYLTLLRRKAALTGYLAAMTAPEPDSLDAATFEFALANTGNVELLVREVTLDVIADGPDLLPELSPETLPAVLKPGEVRLLKLDVPNLFLGRVAFNQGAVVFEFIVFSSTGHSYVLRKSITLRREVHDVSSDAWMPFSLGRRTK